jgi:hypothetical protein
MASAVIFGAQWVCIAEELREQGGNDPGTISSVRWQSPPSKEVRALTQWQRDLLPKWQQTYSPGLPSAAAMGTPFLRNAQRLWQRGPLTLHSR